MKTIELKDLDANKALFHFTDKRNISQIEELGLIPMIGNNSKGIEKTKKVFFSKGNIGFLRICDVWINWIIYGYGMDDYLLSKSKIDSIGIRKAIDEYKEIFKTGKIHTKENIERAFEYMSIFMKQNVLLVLDITEKEQYKSDDIDEAKERANDPEFIEKMYCGYVSSFFEVEEFNMHTKSNTPVLNKQISLVVNENNDNALNILKTIYKQEKEKNKDLTFEFLDDFMEYLRIKDKSLKLRRK